MKIPFAEWRPDLADIANPTNTALNVIPGGSGYKPMPALTAFSNALDARCQGAVSARASDGVVNTFAGDASKLYKLTSSTFADVSKGGGYSTADVETWEFQQFGNNVLATNYTDPVQGWALGSSSAFADHFTSTSKPKARHIGIVRDFSVLGNIDDTTWGTKPNGVWWSAINDSADMDVSQSTLAGRQELPDGGDVQKVVGNVEYGLIFQDYAIRRMTFVGAPLVFDIQVVEKARGTPFPNSVINWGRNTFYLSDEGFFRTDGTSSEPIGNLKVDRTLLEQLQTGSKHRISAAIWPEHKCFTMLFPGEGSSGTPNKLYLYAWDIARWSEVDVDAEQLVRTLTEGYTLDELDAAFGTDIDDSAVYSASFDSRVYQGAEFQLGAFDTSNKLGYFNGASLAPTIDTRETQLSKKGNKTRVRRVRSLVDGSSVTDTLRVAGRNNLDDTLTFDTAVSREASGSFALNKKARYHRFRWQANAGETWDHAVGVDVEKAFESDGR